MNRRHLLTGAAGTAAAVLIPGMAQAAPRRPRPDEVDLRIYQYGGGPANFPVAIGWADDPASGHVHTAPVLHLEVTRPFEFRIEPRWRGGATSLDVIFEVKVDTDIDPVNMNNIEGKGFSNQWAQLVHLGPQTKNREMAQIGQHATMGRGDLLHPMPGRPIGLHIRCDFQLDSQSGPKRVGEGRVLVSRAA